MEIARTIEGHRNGSHVRIRLMEGGEMLSGLWLWPLKVRIGSVVVRMGGIGGVGTPSEHRRKGYSRIVMDDSMAYMIEHGWEMGLLYGIADFYPKFGYAVAMASQNFTMKTRETERARSRHRVRKMRPGDIPAMLRLYHRSNALRTGAVVRTAGKWDPAYKGSGWRKGAVVSVFTGKGGKVVGYAILDDTAESTTLAELAAASADVYESIFAELARDAVAKRCGEITVHAPVDHTAFEVAGRFGARAMVYRPRCGGGMARVANQGNLFETMAPELSRRLSAGGYSSWKGTVAVRTDMGESFLAVSQGKVKALAKKRRASVSLKLDQSVLAQLVLGYRSVADAVSTGDMKLTGKGTAGLAEALFEVGNAYMWLPDHF